MMTFAMNFIALTLCSVSLQIASGMHTNLYNPTMEALQDQAEAQLEAMQNNAAQAQYQALKNNAALNSAIIQNNPLFNYKDILSYPPYALFCDCECSSMIDPWMVNELNRIADQYNQRICDIQQLYLIIDQVMPTLPDQPWRVNMVEYLAKGLYDEQARRQLSYLPEYPSFCNSIYPEAIPTLSKRSPMENLQSSLIPQSVNPSAYYYNLNYLMDKIMPDLSPQFKQDIRDAVYANTRMEEMGQAPELIRRLTSNLRVTVSQMYDYTPNFY